MNSFVFVLASTLAFAAFGFGLEAMLGDHDPGAVFPWLFVALIEAGAGALVGFFGSVAILVLRWMLSL
jgi:hypothetical protein